MAQRSSNIGGQAVMEGIMMRHKDVYSIAVRRPDKEIEVKVEDYKSVIPIKGINKIPILRGVFNFIDSLVVGTKCLMYSARFYEDEEDTKKEEKVLTAEEQAKADAREEKQYKILMGVTVTFSIVISVALFMLLPYFVANLLRHVTTANWIITIAEAVIRIALFLTYMVLVSKMEDIQRVFMYHGAEHKCINCIEHGMELKVENVMKSSRQHSRCGTSFLFIVMIVSIVFFFFIHTSSPVLRVVLRLLLVPVIAGVSYEFIRLAGHSDNVCVRWLSKPGLALQKLTTKEPTEDMCEVAITAVEAVFDWREYLRENGFEVTS